ncbi:MAG: SMI1/KNR4 family protein [Chloroflexota bacterium]
MGTLVRQLRTADPQRRVFGSKQHLYQFRPTITQSEVQTFEHKHHITLPADYRQFILQVGNGGAGPFYGLASLRWAALDSTLHKPFPFITTTNTDSQGIYNGAPDEYPGVLELCHLGCGIYYYLVVNGPTYGTMWEGREDFYPTGQSFGTWYRQWAESTLRILANEPLVDRLAIGMSKAQVIAAIEADWREREVYDGSKYYLEATDIPAQLELNKKRIVIKIRRYETI